MKEEINYNILYFIQFIHSLNGFFIIIYPFLFTTNKYDIYFIIYLFLIFLSYLFFKNECILSYLEKKILDKNYILGSDPFYHPYHHYIPKIFIMINTFLQFIVILILFLRNLKNYFIMSIISIITIYFFYIKLVKYKIIENLF